MVKFWNLLFTGVSSVLKIMGLKFIKTHEPFDCICSGRLGLCSCIAVCIAVVGS